MPLTEFGKVVRRLRDEYDLSQKDMARAMNMGSTYLSALEYGERTLKDEHVQRAIAYFTPMAKPEEIVAIRRAGAGSTSVISTSDVSPDDRFRIAKFARRLFEGKQLTPEVEAWIETAPGELK